MHILIFLLYYFCEFLAIQQRVVQPPYVEILIGFLLELTFNLTALCPEKMHGIISIILNLPRLDLWPRMCSV